MSRRMPVDFRRRPMHEDRKIKPDLRLFGIPARFVSFVCFVGEISRNPRNFRASFSRFSSGQRFS